MKKEIIILIILFISFGLAYFFKEKTDTSNRILKRVEKNIYEKYDFYKEENKNRYELYKITNPTLKTKDIVLRVNIGLDHSFYTNTKEVTTFDKLMLVNKYNYVSNDFQVKDLVKVEEYARENMYLNKECMEAFVKMAKDAEALGYHIRAISTYRTYDYQKKLYENYAKKDGIEKADTYSARPGFSEHHTGLAIDIDNIKLSYDNFENTNEFNWIKDNAYKYGFILRYPKDNTITGYIYEPWHYRYVGIDIATYIYNHQITFDEYYYEFIEKNK